MARATVWLPLAVGVLSLAGVGVLSTALSPSEMSGPAAGASHEVAVETGQIALVCAPGVADSTSLTAAGSQEQKAELGTAHNVWGLMNLEKLDGGGQVALLSEGETRGTGTSISGQPTGDLASFLVENCQSTSRELAFASGSTVVGEDTVLVLSNPAAKPVNVQMEILGTSGPVLESPVTVVVPAASTVGILPGSYTRDVQSPIIILSADGSGVAAWLQTSGLDGEVPLGVARTPGVKPKSTVVLAGVEGGKDATLRVGNVGPETAEATIKVMSKGGVEALVGAETIRIPARSSSEIVVGELPGNTSALLIESDHDVVAAVTETSTGNKHPDVKGAKYGSRTVVAPAQALTEANLVNGSQMLEVAQELGFKDISVSLVVANISDTAVELEMQGVAHTLEGTSSQTFPLLPESARNRFTASQPVYIAYLVTVETPVGALRSVTPVGVEGVLAQSRTVVLEPAA